MCQEARGTETKPGKGGTEILKKNLLTNSTRCAIMSMSRGEPRLRQLPRTVETDTKQSPQESRLLGSVVRALAGAGTRQRSEPVTEIIKKVRNFLRKPLDKFKSMCYNKYVIKRSHLLKSRKELILWLLSRR
jgi:hypothetical protein